MVVLHCILCRHRLCAAEGYNVPLSVPSWRCPTRTSSSAGRAWRTHTLWRRHHM